jgi:hypothetical protein
MQEGPQSRTWPHARKSCFQFDANEIVRILEAPLALAVARISPPRPDDSQYHGAVPNHLVKVTAKILPQRDRIHILEHAHLAELGYQPVVDATGGIRIVAAPVADEDAAQLLCVTCGHQSSILRGSRRHPGACMRHP